MTRALAVTACFGLCLSMLACGSSSSSTGAGGSSGTTGAGGTTGAAGSGGGFMSVAPCTMESAYSTGTIVDFSSTATYAYTPQCLKVAAGSTVTFTGDFGTHPLSPSAKRGTLTGNPITATSAGTTKTFTFPNPGFYAYYCTVHGASDGAAGMVGVIWVE
jgi:plastocyanin